MYYVPDGTKICGYYECKKCGTRFLSLQTMERRHQLANLFRVPDECMEDVMDTACLQEVIEGEEDVEKMDTLLSLAITGGDFGWI